MAHLGSTPRFVEVMRPLIFDVLGFLASWILAPTHHDTTTSAASQIFHTFAGAQWHVQLAKTLSASFRETRLAYFESGSAVALSVGNTFHVYEFVRETLGDPMLTAKYDVEGIDVHVSRSHLQYSSQVGAIAGVLLSAECCEQDLLPPEGTCVTN